MFYPFWCERRDIGVTCHTSTPPYRAFQLFITELSKALTDQVIHTAGSPCGLTTTPAVISTSSLKRSPHSALHRDHRCMSPLKWRDMWTMSSLPSPEAMWAIACVREDGKGRERGGRGIWYGRQDPNIVSSLLIPRQQLINMAPQLRMQILGKGTLCTAHSNVMWLHHLFYKKHKSATLYIVPHQGGEGEGEGREVGVLLCLLLDQPSLSCRCLLLQATLVLDSIWPVPSPTIHIPLEQVSSHL